MDYFDYSGKVYGKPEDSIEKYKFFLHIEATHVGGFAEMDMYFYFLILQGNILELVMAVSRNDFQQEADIIGRFKLTDPFQNRVLYNYVSEYIKHGRNYFSLGYIFHESTIIFQGRVSRSLLNLPRTTLDTVHPPQFQTYSQ